MAVLSYRRARNRYKDDGDMLETLHRMEEFDEFHLLRSGNISTGERVKKLTEKVPDQVVSWYSVCDGGLLFDTALLSLDGHDKDLDVDFDTFGDYNTEELYGMMGLPEGYYIIAVRSYGDPICISQEDGRIYLWDREEQEFDTIWECFNDFLGDETDTAIELIAEDSLEPIPLKLNPAE